MDVAGLPFRPQATSAATDGCPLCAVADGASVWLRVWSAHALSGEAREREVDAALSEAGLTMTPTGVARHMQYHGKAQPDPGLRWARQHADSIADELTAREREVMRFIGRVRRVTVSQVADAFFAHRNEVSAQAGARRVLLKLIYNHVLCRVLLPARVAGSRQVYELGKVGTVLRRRELECDPTVHDVRPFIASGEVLRIGQYPHDLGLLDALTALVARCRRDFEQELGGRSVRVTVPPANIWAARYLLGFGYTVPSFTSPLGVRHAGFDNLYPDAFLTVGIEAAGKSFGLPLFWEWDTGSKKVPEVGEQLWRYIPLALSRVVGRRFPRLDVPGYNVPLLFVTQSCNPRNTQRRVKGLVEEVAALHVARRFHEPRYRGAWAPIYIVAKSAFTAQGLQASALALHRNGQREPLLTALYRDSAPLLRQAPLRADEDVVLVVEGGRTHGIQERGARTLRAEREELERNAQADAILDELEGFVGGGGSSASAGAHASRVAGALTSRAALPAGGVS